MSEKKNNLNIGSRKSELALIQTRHVIKLLKQQNPDVECTEITRDTIGDKILDQPLPKIGEKSLFTKELDVALMNKEVDFVVHSLKDLPTTLPEGTTIGAILKRENPCDVVILHKQYSGKTLETLPKNCVIGTSSLRRQAQLIRKHPHLKVDSIRGNLNSRLRKLDEDGQYSAIVLAAAGVSRMGWNDRISYELNPDEMLYAVGQGALAVQCHIDNLKILNLLHPLNDRETVLQVIAERSFLLTLGGGCTAPVAVHSMLDKNTLHLTGAVWSLNGAETLQLTRKVELDNETNGVGPPRKILRDDSLLCGIWVRNFNQREIKAANHLGVTLADELNKFGAEAIMKEAKDAIQKSILVRPVKQNSTS